MTDATADVTPPLAAAARDPRWWWHAVRLHPWLVGGALLGCLAVELSGVLLPDEGPLGVLDGMLGAASLWTWLILFLVRDQVLKRADAVDGSLCPPARRAPVDVRVAATQGSAGLAAAPTWSWWSPLGRTTGAIGGLTLAIASLLGAGVVVLVMDHRWFSIVMGLVVLLPVTLLILAFAALALLEVPAGARHIVRSVAQDGTAPVLVRVLGVEPEGGRWFLALLDGGQTVVVDAFRGRSRIVAGDVVNLWRAPERDGLLADRVALTGPFGTLFPALDQPEADGGVEEPVVPGAGRLRPVRRADGTLVRPRRTSPPR